MYNIDIDAGVESTVLQSLHSIVFPTFIADDVRDYTLTSPAGSSDVKALFYNTVSYVLILPLVINNIYTLVLEQNIPNNDIILYNYTGITNN